MRFLRRARSLSCAVFIFWSTAGAGESLHRQPVTAADTVETRRMLALAANGDPALTSPDGKRFCVASIQGDLKLNGNWLEIFCGGLQSLEAAAEIKSVARLFSKDRLGPLGVKLLTAAFAPVWMRDNRRMVFLWNDGECPTQIMTIDVTNGEVLALTHSATSILNTPPSLFAMDTSGSKQLKLMEVAPAVKDRMSLGRVEIIQWTDADRTPWSALLYYPMDYLPTRRYPLVIQTHGYSRKKFSLIGDESLTSVNAAQPLAGRGIAVVQMDRPDLSVREAGSTPMEPVIQMRGYESLVEHLAERGIVDPKKVGLAGFSRTGWHVEYALAQSEFPFAAAIAADNMSASYVEAMLGNRIGDEYVHDNGGEAFGAGLAMWLANSPGFNADRVQAPLRLEVDAGGIVGALGHWEIFVRMRYLAKPVELFVVPEAEYGSHPSQIPSQQLASREGAVDWFDFWLNGHEDENSAKNAQYTRWRKLRELHAAGLKKLRPPRLKWSAQPY